MFLWKRTNWNLGFVRFFPVTAEYQEMVLQRLEDHVVAMAERWRWPESEILRLHTKRRLNYIDRIVAICKREQQAMDRH